MDGVAPRPHAPSPGFGVEMEGGPTTPGDGTVGNTNHKHRQCRVDNLVDFVKDFNQDYLARVQMQENEKRLHCSNIFALAKEREMCNINKR